MIEPDVTLGKEPGEMTTEERRVAVTEAMVSVRLNLAGNGILLAKWQEVMDLWDEYLSGVDRG